MCLLASVNPLFLTKRSCKVEMTPRYFTIQFEAGCVVEGGPVVVNRLFLALIFIHKAKYTVGSIENKFLSFFRGQDRSRTVRRLIGAVGLAAMSWRLP